MNKRRRYTAKRRREARKRPLVIAIAVDAAWIAFTGWEGY
jgi:hypothetical protein